MLATIRPVNSLGRQGGEEFSESGPNILNYVHYFQNVSNIFFQRGAKNFPGGLFAPLVTVLATLN